MKKIPTLFIRKFENHKIVDVLDEITPGCEEAFRIGEATIKIDGSCCAIFNGVFYKRYDAKKGKVPPTGAIPCCDPDPITGHHPHWVKVDFDDPSDKWFAVAYKNTYISYKGINRTFEAVGPHFNGNPYDYNYDMLIPHAEIVIDDLQRDFVSVKDFLEKEAVEGLVFWLNGEPICKIKRSDFGFEWPIKENKNG